MNDPDTFNPITWRIKIFFYRWVDYSFHIPLRILRLLNCLFLFHRFYGKHKWQRWVAATFMLLVDITPVSVIYECVMDWIKTMTRPLNKAEKDLAITIYADHLPYHLIGLDPVSIPVRKKMAIAFTTMHTINFYQNMSSATLIHELMHVWQYRKFGAMYITESIWAQRWGGGYNYGGMQSLRLSSEIGLKAFNFEQQAEIMEDYFRLMNNQPLQWVSSEPELKALLEKYVNEVRL